MANPLHALLFTAFHEWVVGDAAASLLGYLGAAIYRIGAPGKKLNATHTI